MCLILVSKRCSGYISSICGEIISYFIAIEKINVSCSYILTLVMQVLYIYGNYEISLWPQTARRQVGAEPSVAIMVFRVQHGILP